MSTAACKECPFRIGAPMSYDADAIEALNDGCEPSCHMAVGVDAIFCAEPPAHRCHGHDLWCAGAPGFQTPKEIPHA